MRKKKFRKAYSVKRKKSVIKNRFFRLGILIIFLAGEAFYLLFFSPIFRIKSIQISGNERLLAANIESEARNEMFKEYGDNIFRLRSAKIGEALTVSFPEIAKIELKRIFPDNLKIKIEERLPVAVFCQQDTCFNVDEGGVIFNRPSASSSVEKELPKIENQTFSLKANPGDIVISERLLAQIMQIETEFKNNLKISTAGFLVVSEQRLDVKAAQGWEVYFNLKGDLAWQITELSVILNEKIPPQRRKNLEYIDLRFDKVFVAPEGIVDK